MIRMLKVKKKKEQLFYSGPITVPYTYLERRIVWSLSNNDTVIRSRRKLYQTNQRRGIYLYATMQVCVAMIGQ